MKFYLPEDDLQQILARTKSLLPAIKGKTILLTGGTGFFGKWLTGSFIYINRQLGLNAKLYVLSRNPQKFLSAHPNLSDDAVVYIKGDISDFEFGEAPLHYIIHAATEASATLNTESPALMYDTIVEGTRHILELAERKKVLSVLLTSSGAVYGTQPVTVSHLSETDTFAPNVLANNAAYGEGKRVAEMLCAMYHRQYNLNTKIARCFAFAGPHLPLDAHFALGNFIHNALYKEKIVIGGDGTPLRSYLYAADLVIWLWHILLKGKANEAYNVGSDEEISIHQLAEKISNLAGRLQVEVKHKALPGVAPARYVPSVEKAKEQLGLEVYTGLDAALTKMFDFYTSAIQSTNLSNENK